MFRKGIFPVTLVTVYLVVYCTLLQWESTRAYASLMLLTAPVMIIWMVLTVLKNGNYSGGELGAEEFGYEDKNKNDLGVF